VSAGLQPSTRLLLECVTGALTGSISETARRSVEQLSDWSRFRDQAWNNGVTPLVHGHLHALSDAGAPVPADQLERFRVDASAIAAVNLRLTAELFRVSTALRERGVNAIAYKGPVLAWRAFGDLALRHFNDLDLLVRRKEIAVAQEVLTELGLRLRDPAPGAATTAALRWGHHFSFVRDADTLIELHWRFYKPLFGHASLEESAHANASEEAIAGRTLRVLSIRDELLVLATHGSWHSWSQLSWVVDVAALADRRSDWDPADLLTGARESGQERPVLLAFELARLLLGVRPAPEIELAIAADGVVAVAATRIRARIDAGGLDGPATARLQLSLRKGLREKCAFAARAALTPNPSDVAAVHLRDWQFPLYRVIRPVRMALKYRPGR
jgi:hypothetical protein